MTGRRGSGLRRGDWDTGGVGMGKRGSGGNWGYWCWAGERAAEVTGV